MPECLLPSFPCWCSVSPDLHHFLSLSIIIFGAIMLSQSFPHAVSGVQYCLPVDLSLGLQTFWQGSGHNGTQCLCDWLHLLELPYFLEKSPWLFTKACREIRQHASLNMSLPITDQLKHSKNCQLEVGCMSMKTALWGNVQSFSYLGLLGCFLHG